MSLLCTVTSSIRYQITFSPNKTRISIFKQSNIFSIIASMSIVVSILVRGRICSSEVNTTSHNTVRLQLWRLSMFQMIPVFQLSLADVLTSSCILASSIVFLLEQTGPRLCFALNSATMARSLTILFNTLWFPALSEVTHHCYLVLKGCFTITFWLTFMYAFEVHRRMKLRCRKSHRMQRDVVN